METNIMGEEDRGQVTGDGLGPSLRLAMYVTQQRADTTPGLICDAVDLTDEGIHADGFRLSKLMNSVIIARSVTKDLFTFLYH